MNLLIAVATCHQYRARAQAQRDTWAKCVIGADVRFFLGRQRHAVHEPINQPLPDEIFLGVGDGYEGLPSKTQAICKWALENGYEGLWKSDDDVYIQPDRLLASINERTAYAGRLRGASGIFPAPYCSGFLYWLNRAAMQVVTDAKLNGDEAEDRWVGNILRQAGFLAQHDQRMVCINSKRNSVFGWEGPRQGNEIIAACEFNQETTESMREIHRQWLECSSIPRRRVVTEGKLSKVSIFVKTFLRDGYLFRCVSGIHRTMPEAKMVIVDDGMEGPRTASKITLYSQLRHDGHVCLNLDYDSGFGAKGNAAIPFFDREYVLIGSDDFDFAPPEVRKGIEKLVAVLDGDPTIHIVSGRVNGNAYESCLEIGDGWVKEIPEHRETRTVNGVTYLTCDLTVNYSLIRSSCFGPEKLHWDGGEVKIGGGEHGCFFVDAKKLGYGVAVVPEVSIKEFPFDPQMIHPNYPAMRGRARKPGRACQRARGILKWGLQDGSWELS